MHPPIEVLTRGLCAAARAGTPVPAEILDYIEGRLDGTIKPKEGRPKGRYSDTVERERELAQRVTRVRWLCESNPKYTTDAERAKGGAKRRGALSRALEQVARESRQKESALRTYYQRHRKHIAADRLREAEQALRDPQKIPLPDFEKTYAEFLRGRDEYLARKAKTG